MNSNALHTVPFLSQLWCWFQDPEDGGISDRPGNMVDVFHTHFGIAGVCGARLGAFLLINVLFKDFLFWDILI